MHTSTNVDKMQKQYLALKDFNECFFPQFYLFNNTFKLENKIKQINKMSYISAKPIEVLHIVY